MTVLALDTTSRATAWALAVQGDGALVEACQVSGGELDRTLPSAISTLLAHTPAAVVVLTGPGSYSGVRAGMAAALGVASARGIPLHGVSSLCAVAAAAHRPSVLAVVDAGRGGVYTARFARRDGTLEQLGELVRLSVAALQGGVRPVSTTAIPGLSTTLVDPVAALCAAVPLALRSAPLQSAGLAAVHAPPQATEPRPPATLP